MNRTSGPVHLGVVVEGMDFVREGGGQGKLRI